MHLQVIKISKHWYLHVPVERVHDDQVAFLDLVHGQIREALDEADAVDEPRVLVLQSVQATLAHVRVDGTLEVNYAGANLKYVKIWK